MPFIKGQSGNPGGLPKGYKHTSTMIKEKFLTAFQKSGGLEELVRWIKEKDSNRKEFYKMVIQLLPKDLNFEGDALNNNFNVIVKVDNGDNSSQKPSNRISEYFKI